MNAVSRVTMACPDPPLRAETSREHLPSGSRVAEPDAATTDRGQLHRGLSQRHIMFIALGTAVGTGLFYGSAGGIQAAGPGVILSFLVAGAAVFLVMRALGEMTLREPVSGSFAAYASRYLGPFAGYVTGWTFVFELAVVIIADTAAITTYMAFWFPGSRPGPGSPPRSSWSA